MVITLIWGLGEEVGGKNTEIRQGSFPDSSRVLFLKKLTDILLGFAGLRRIAKTLFKNPL